MYGILLIICVFTEIYCFQRQRAALEIGRKMDFDVRKVVLPPWFIIMWGLPIVTMYCISHTFEIAWYFSIAVYICFIIVSSALPIRKSFYIDTLDKLRLLRNEGKVIFPAHSILIMNVLYEQLKES